MSKSITRHELATVVADKSGISIDTSRRVVEHILDAIESGLKGGRRIELRGIGTFTVRTRKATIGRNPKNPSVAVPIPERRVIRYKASRLLLAALNS